MSDAPNGQNDVTNNMIQAGQAAEADWRAHQSGSLYAAIYFAMRKASGVSDEDLEAERMAFHGGHVDAGIAAEAVWKNNQSGPLHGAIYRALRAIV